MGHSNTHTHQKLKIKITPKHKFSNDASDLPVVLKEENLVRNFPLLDIYPSFHKFALAPGATCTVTCSCCPLQPSVIGLCQPKTLLCCM